MELVPTWRTPHHLTALLPKRKRPAVSVVTYSLVSVELVRADLRTPGGVNRLGYEWLAQLAGPAATPLEALEKELGIRSPLEAFLQKELGIRSPGHRWQPPTPARNDASTLLRAAELFEPLVPRIEEWQQLWYLEPLVEEIERAADERDRLDASRVRVTDIGDAIAVAQRLRDATPGLNLKPMRRQSDDRELLGPHFSTLEQRIAYELFELFWTRPRLRRCRFCRRPFPASRDAGGTARSTCSAHLYSDTTGKVLEFCSPKVLTHNDRILVEQNRRESKTLLQRIYDAKKAAKRAEARHGANSPEAKHHWQLVGDHELAYNQWREKHPRLPRGRKTDHAVDGHEQITDA